MRRSRMSAAIIMILTEGKNGIIYSPEEIEIDLFYSPEYYYNSLNSIDDNSKSYGGVAAQIVNVKKPLADSRTIRRDSSSGLNNGIPSFSDYLNSSGKEWWPEFS